MAALRSSPSNVQSFECFDYEMQSSESNSIANHAHYQLSLDWTARAVLQQLEASRKAQNSVLCKGFLDWPVKHRGRVELRPFLRLDSTEKAPSKGMPARFRKSCFT